MITKFLEDINARYPKLFHEGIFKRDMYRELMSETRGHIELIKQQALDLLEAEQAYEAKIRTLNIEVSKYKQQELAFLQTFGAMEDEIKLLEKANEWNTR